METQRINVGDRVQHLGTAHVRVVRELRDNRYIPTDDPAAAESVIVHSDDEARQPRLWAWLINKIVRVSE